MSATVRERTEDVQSVVTDVRYAYEGTHNGYVAQCPDCAWSGTFHAISLESAPKWNAIRDADFHNRQVHPA